MAQAQSQIWLPWLSWERGCWTSQRLYALQTPQSLAFLRERATSISAVNLYEFHRCLRRSSSSGWWNGSLSEFKRYKNTEPPLSTDLFPYMLMLPTTHWLPRQFQIDSCLSAGHFSASHHLMRSFGFSSSQSLNVSVNVSEWTVSPYGALLRY